MRKTEGSVRALCILLSTACSSVASAQSELYATTSSGRFGRLNVQTGAFVQISNTPGVITGLGWASDGQLYGLQEGSAGGPLYRINPATGAAAFVGNTGIPTVFLPGTTAAGYAMGATSDGTLYAFSWQYPAPTPLANLFTINPATAASTLVGNMGFQSSGYVAGDGSSTLYASTGLNNQLYRLDRTTGNGTLVGSGSFTSNVFAMGFVGGSMYAIETNGGISTWNLANGSSTLVAAYNPGQIGQVFAAAPIPGPASAAGLVAGVVVLARRRHEAPPRPGPSRGTPPSRSRMGVWAASSPHGERPIEADELCLKPSGR